MLLQMIGEILGLSALLFAFVAWLKQVGIEGPKLTICSLAGGWLIGGLIRYATVPPITVAEWIWLFLYGLIAGLVASGAYKGFEFAAKTDPASLTKAKQADSAQTAKVVAAIEGSSETQLPS